MLFAAECVCLHTICAVRHIPPCSLPSFLPHPLYHHLHSPLPSPPTPPPPLPHLNSCLSCIAQFNHTCHHVFLLCSGLPWSPNAQVPLVEEALNSPAISKWYGLCWGGREGGREGGRGRRRRRKRNSNQTQLYVWVVLCTNIVHHQYYHHHDLPSHLLLWPSRFSLLLLLLVRWL